MRRILLNVLTVCCLSNPIIAQTGNEKFSVMEKSFNTLQSKQIEQDKKILQLSTAMNKNNGEILYLTQQHNKLCKSIDSLKAISDSLEKAQIAYKADVTDKIKDTNNMLDSNRSLLESRILWGSIIILSVFIVLFLVYYLLTKRIRNGTNTIDNVRKAQDALQTAQIKMQEESVKLDTKLIDLIEKQIAATDHSFALRVADEIVRMELNLSRMDSSVKGYKQLDKAVQRIKNTFKANGYEIVGMLGTPYHEGMRVTADFVFDENLDAGKQIITGITKPQVNYNGIMIQAAQITVSQNI